MFIESLKVSYPSEGWSLEETKFDRFNLLVGASGVGKTKILEAITFLADLALNRTILESHPSNVIVWHLVMRALDGRLFEWEGRAEIEEFAERKGQDRHFEARFDFERLSESGREIVTRQRDIVKFSDFNLPKLNENLSIINLFETEGQITEISNELKNTFPFSEIEMDKAFLNDLKEIELWEGLTVDGIRRSSANVALRLGWLKSHPEGKIIFERIRDRYIEIFPFVDDLLEGVDFRQTSPRFYWNISEHGLLDSFSLGTVSTGMRKTLALLAQIELCPDNSLILIDEFENSLGANCIDLVAEAVQNAGRGLQFIITSHHPYIINRIGAKHWKIVTRKGGVVTTHTAEELGIGRSRHENFSQLTQLEAFQTGVMSE